LSTFAELRSHYESLHQADEDFAAIPKGTALKLIAIAEAAQKALDSQDPLGFGGYSPWECVFCEGNWRADEHDIECEFVALRTALAVLPQDHVEDL